MKNGCCPVANKLAENGSVIVSKLIAPMVACSNSCAILSLNANLSCSAPILAKKLSADKGPLDPNGSSEKTIPYVE